MIDKLIRFVHNPRPYLDKMWYGWWIRPVVWPVQIWWYRKFMLPSLVKTTSKKDPIRVLFLAMSVSYWKYDTLYRRMAADPRFDPLIMPAMRTNQSFEDQIKDHDELMEEFSKRGYNITPGYDKTTGRFLSASALNPDIVFYTHPYSGPGRHRKQYDFWAMRKSLICYAPYYFPNENDAFFFNHPIQNAAWQLYYAYEQIRPVAMKAMRNKGVNIKIAGYVFGEELREISKAEADAAWCNDKSGRKRIIWAPHHSVSDTDTVARTSTFLEYCELMKEIAVKYKDRILLVFKPHPVLYSRLEGCWGKQKTDEYFDFWRNQENAWLETGDYTALFKGSDAMIHDSGSFKCEYLYVGKPCMFLYRKDFLKDLNEVGCLALEAHYSGYSSADILKFIEETVLSGEDCKADIRLEFREKYIKSSSGKEFSENVINEILNGLNKI